MCRRKGDFALQREHSHDCVYMCVRTQERARFVCELRLGQTDTPTGCRPLYPVRVVRLSKHYAPLLSSPPLPPRSPFPTGLTGVEAAEGVGTVNRTKPPF